MKSSEGTNSENPDDPSERRWGRIYAWVLINLTATVLALAWFSSHFSQ